LFVDLDYLLFDKFTVSAALRGVSYHVQESNFKYLEPRLGFTYNPKGSEFQYSLGVSKMTQPLHLLNSTFGLPNDIWLTANEIVPPSQAWQINSGIAKKVKPLNLFLSAEVYYKYMSGLTDYSEGFVFEGITSGTLNELLEIDGEGRSYGAELYAKIENRQWNAEFAYTYSKTQFRFPDINKGEFYPSSFDRRHDFSMSVNYAISKKWDLSTTWILQSGRPYTFPEAIVQAPDGQPFILYGDRNNKRLSTYHRLDVGLQYSFVKKHRNRTISFGVINAYNRQNPFVIFPEAGFRNDTFRMNFSQRSLLPVIPYFSYKIDLFRKK